MTVTRKKIAFFIYCLGGGGAEKMALRVLNHWAMQGHDVTCFTFDDGQNIAYPLPDAVQLISLNLAPGEVPKGVFAKLTLRLKHIAALRKTIKRHAPDIVVSFVFVTNVLVILATRGLGCKTIIAERNDPARQSEGRFWDFLRQRTYKYADIVTVNSRNAIEALRRFVPEQKLIFTPNVLSVPESQYLATQENRENMILCTARLHPQKDHATLLRAFALIHEKYSDWRLVLAGSGQEEGRLKGLSRTLNINDKVSFPGYIENPYSYLSKTKIFVLPSLYEGTPNALLEAMSCGVPSIVSSAAHGALEFIQNSQQIFTVGNENDLAQKLKALMDAPDMQIEVGKAGVEAVKPLQSPDILKKWDMLL